jgi:plastocyanin
MRIARLLLVGIVLALPACGDGGGGTPGACSDPVEAHRVQLEDFAFRPDCLTAAEGSMFRLANTGQAPHTFTIEGTVVDYNVPAGTATDASVSRLDAGRYTVTCTYHPQMEATLTVG